MAKLRKEMLVQSKLEHCSVIGSYLELQILDLGPFYMDGKIRHRPTTFMWSPRFNKAVFKSKLQQQRRSPNLSCSPDTVQCSAHISSSRSPNDLKFLPWKDETISQNFHEVCSNYDVINDVFGRQEDKNCHQVKMWPPTHQLVNKSIVPNFGL